MTNRLADEVGTLLVGLTLDALITEGVRVHSLAARAIVSEIAGETCALAEQQRVSPHDFAGPDGAEALEMLIREVMANQIEGRKLLTEWGDVFRAATDLLTKVQ